MGLLGLFNLFYYFCIGQADPMVIYYTEGFIEGVLL